MYYVNVPVGETSGRPYVGYTGNLRRRLSEHNTEHSGYTGREQWRLAYYETYASAEDAWRRERRLKDGREFASCRNASR